MTQYRTHGRVAAAACILAAIGALVAAPVMAIELGAARLKSAPEAPLDIEIPLLDVAPDELESLKPQLPANARSPELAAASIELAANDSGAPVLRIRTAQAVTANDLRFVVIADWGRGRKFREYTLSLIASAAPAVSAALEVAPPPVATEAASPSPPAVTTFSTQNTEGSADIEAPAAVSGLKTTRVVRNNETLMSISREWSARTGATLAQTMLGIFEANPQAFGPRGMNELLVGAEIVLPEAATLASNSPAVASAEIGRVLGIWRTAPAAATPAAPLVPVAPAPPVIPESTVAPAAAAAAPESAAVPAAVAASEAAAVAETPAALLARLQLELVDKTAQLAAATTEIAALQSRLRSAEQASAASARVEGTNEGWLGEVRRLAALVWWAIPLLLVTTLALLLALLLRRRRADSDEQTTPSATESQAQTPTAFPAVSAPVEMTFELPPIKASRASEGMPDVLLGEAPRARRLADESLPEDLEGDPPPIDEAGSKINLARAFIEMGHYDAAILELQAALRLGDETQRAEALRLLDSLPKS